MSAARADSATAAANYSHSRVRKRAPPGRPLVCRTLLLSILLAASLGGSVFMWAHDVYKRTLQDSVVLENNTQAFMWWQKPPVQPLMKIYVLNYSNPQRLYEGKDLRPRVNEVGPYTYRMQLERVNVRLHPDNTVSYQEKRSFDFAPELSVGNPDLDKVVVPNIILITAVNELRELFFVYQVAMDTAFRSFGTKPFVQVPVSNLLWGYSDPLFDLAKLRHPMPIDKFGLLATKNGVDQRRLRIGTGAGDPNKLGVFTSIDGHSSLGKWSTADCNSIQGTDGSIFPPSAVSTRATLHLFQHALCRRIPLEFRHHSQVAGNIPTLRFQFPRNVFDSAYQNPENACFCHPDADFCPPSGVFNTSGCTFGAPIFLSFPHFYLGDPSLINAVDGLTPNETLHDSYVDIYPKLGVPLAGWSRIQINIMVRTTPYMQTVKCFKDRTILPIAWIEMGLDDLPSDFQSLFVHVTYSARVLQLILLYGLPTLSLVFLYLLWRQLRLCRGSQILVPTSSA
ncbi:lysosome membrane protein 2-like [Schistocerca cancellata]|uniref:lysosome membrane protein 2-like n=1 Tax=Schistocerca cancellata TaxID=274614 RepID=UPI00211819E7|nr:lysosome membrane protein 2-like [Schistocerca cancellata]